MKPTLARRLQSIRTTTIYAVLLVCASVPLFFKVKLPNVPLESSIDFFGNLMTLKEGDRVLIGSDWTNSLRGESGAQMEDLMRIVMRRHLKFCLYSTGDPQSPQVARDVIARVAHEEAKNVGYEYQPFRDFVVAGYFPNGDGTNLAMNNDILKAFAGRKELPEGGVPTDIRRSPVFEGIRTISDFKLLVLVTGSGTNTSTLERVTNIPLMFMVTGVMVPENQNYYDTKQLKGMVGGVKGALDLETLMESGLNTGEPGSVSTDHFERVDGFKGMSNEGKGTVYYPTLHACLLLLIVAIVLGNVGMFLGRKEDRTR